MSNWLQFMLDFLLLSLLSNVVRGWSFYGQNWDSFFGLFNPIRFARELCLLPRVHRFGLILLFVVEFVHLWLKVNYLYTNVDFESKVMIIFCCSSRKFHYWYALTTNLNLFFVAYKLLYSQLLSFHL